MTATSTAGDSGPGSAFGPVRQIVAGLLDVGYVDAGPASGPAVVLLHGWPYDIHSYAEVTRLLVSAGYRVIVPAAYRAKFSGPYEHRVISGGIGHDLPQEAPRAFAEAVIATAALTRDA